MVGLTFYRQFDCIANLGDLVDGFIPLPSQKNDIAICVDTYKKAKCDYLQIVGNHDDNSWFAVSGSTANGTKNKTEMVDDKTWFDIVTNKIESIGVNHEKRYFTKDYADKKIRLICLDTLDVDYDLVNSNGEMVHFGQWTYGLRQEQLNWLADSLKLPSNWSVIVLSHHCFADGASQSNVGIKNSDLVRGMLNAFKNGTSFTKTSSNTDEFKATVSVDYSSFGAHKVIACLSGHNHAEASYVVDGINHIQFDNCCYIPSNDSDNLKNTYGLVNVLCVDTTNKTIIDKHIGYGSDRSFTY